jgi:DNA-binding IclR family transcriptional regulator
MVEDESSDKEVGAPPSGGVDAVDRALAILTTFEVGHERQTLAELAARTGFYKSTILRLARSLEGGGYLHREENGTFALGPEPLRLASVFRQASALESRVRPVLRALRDATGETVSFFRREGNRRQCLYREETRRAVRDHLMEGDVLPLDVGAGGHVLALFGDPFLPEAERARRFADLPFMSFGERDPETAAIAAPVFNHEGLVGALSISGPRTRLTPERAAEISPLILAQAEALSKILGGAALWPIAGEPVRNIGRVG